jgi:protease I
MPAIADAKILIMATDGFEESELFGPRQILAGRGAEVRLAAPSMTPIQATVHDDPGRTIQPDLTISEAKAEDFDALVLPGGVINPDALRTNRFAVALVQAFVAARKPVAAICHGPWMLVEANVVRGRRLTSYPSLQTDIRNAGGDWVDEQVVTDNGLVTSRKPDDLQAFCDKAIEEFAEGEHMAPAERGLAAS